MAKKALPVFHTASNTYTAIALVGEGGAGVVYSVTDDEGLTFAVKALRQDDVTSSHRKRFMNELKFCLENRHSRIIRVLDSGFQQVGDRKYPFFVMPLFPSTLRKMMGQNVAPEIMLRTYSDILDGVEAAHLLKVWHRDLKPENILLNDKTNGLVVADFGIAHFGADILATEIATKHTDRLANFQYAAPEQRDRSGRTDQRTDIYSLGLILNEMFTGVIPHGAGYRTIANAHSDFGYLDPIVDRMIQQSPDRRYASIDEVKKALDKEQALFASRQKLSALEKTVVPISQPDDPLLREAISITSVDYQKGQLFFRLSQQPNNDWAHAFSTISGHKFFIGRGPETFSFGQKEISVAVSESEAQRMVDFAKDYVRRANLRYAEQIRNKTESTRIKQEQALERERQEEEARQRILRAIQL